MAEWRIITAPRDHGKTTTAIRVAEILGPRCRALVTVSHDGKHDLFLRDMKTGEEMLLMSDSKTIGDMLGAKYSWSSQAFDAARAIMNGADEEYLLIDEVGRLETSGRGFSSLLSDLRSTGHCVILSVRDVFVPEVMEMFCPDAVVMGVDGEAVEWAVKEISSPGE